MNKYKLDDCDSDDDPVVTEIPVYHSARLQKNLYVFQSRDDITSKFREGEISDLSFKPENQETKFKVGVYSYATKYKESSSRYDDSDDEESVSIDSRKTVNATEDVCIAAFNGREIHLTTIGNLFKLNLDYQQSEKANETKKKEDVGSSEEEAGPSNPTQVTVKFKQNPKPNQKQMVCSKSHKAKIDSEKWIECDLCTPESTVSEVERMKLYTEYMHETNQSNNLDEKGYFKHIVQEDQEQSAVEPALPSHLISLNALRALPLLEQCRLLLKDAQIVQFQQLMMLLAGCAGLTTDSLLKTLPKVAVLIRGNWVVKSEVLYPPESLSAICGVPAENMCRARDYLLYLFTKHQFVERKKVASIVKVPAEEVKEIFKGISSLRHNKGWELNLQTDFDFIAKHPDIEQRQSLLWEQRYIQVCDFLKEKKRRKSRSESKSISEDKKSGQCNSSDESGTEKTKSPPRKKKKTDH